MLSRLKVNPTPGNREAAIMLSNKISEILGVKTGMVSAQVFLQQILKEYIILTR